MISLKTLHFLGSRKLATLVPKTCVRFTATKASGPLRILFCGSDDFSCASLQALSKLQRTVPERVKSIDVLCRPPKRTGRGLKSYREVAIASAARVLGLPLHQIDTFRGWKLPRYDRTSAEHEDDGSIDLVVAVSFGLLIPARVLNETRYGGLNVHPSLLPDFRGAAPIEHTLLADRTKTGVTLQTLHPTKMDHGQILLQWPEGGLDIPRPGSIKPRELRELLAEIGASMLVHGIQNGLYVPPIQECTPLSEHEGLRDLRKAPKIVPEDHHIRWAEWTAEEILRRQRVLGPLWNNVVVGGQTIRLTFHLPFNIVEGGAHANVPPGVLLCDESSTQRSSTLRCKTADGKFLCFERIKVPGFGEQEANVWARKAGLFASDSSRDIELGSHGTFALASAELA